MERKTFFGDGFDIVRLNNFTRLVLNTEHGTVKML